nr:unnamed protein product [Callosobruchus analis]
MFSPFAVRKC